MAQRPQHNSDLKQVSQSCLFKPHGSWKAEQITSMMHLEGCDSDLSWQR